VIEPIAGPIETGGLLLLLLLRLLAIHERLVLLWLEEGWLRWLVHEKRMLLRRHRGLCYIHTGNIHDYLFYNY